MIVDSRMSDERGPWGWKREGINTSKLSQSDRGERGVYDVTVRTAGVTEL
jgi:hypothetical protein